MMTSENTSQTLYDELVTKKSEIEEKIAGLNQILFENGNVGMTGNLVDPQGYPRNDIDIYKVRETRQEINCLQNDFKVLMGQIERELYKKYSYIKHNGIELKSSNEQKVNPSFSTLKPFIRITQVDADSPSSEAGLKLDDLILQIGPFRHSPTEKITLNQIAEHVKSHVNKIILMSVVRKVKSDENADDVSTQFLTLKLIPKTWNGHGFLGCKLVMLD